MDLNTTWFLLIWVLLAGYAILDGFDLGVGVLHLFARDEGERRVHVGAIGPFWDGNEVWLLTGGGALFAAFPIVYATVFSSFYLALMLLLLAMIFRAVSLEFRHQVDVPGWQRVWDWAFGLGSLIPAILFGVAIGNILRGIPIEADGTANVPFLSLLNPYALLIGVLSLALFTMHGAAFLAVKTEGDLQQRMIRWTVRAWVVFVGLYLVATIATVFVSPFLFEGALGNPLLWIFFVLLLAAIIYVPIANRAGRFFRAFLASSVTIASMIGLAAVSLFPRLAPSSIDLANSLTAYNASSTPRTLTVMLVIALIGMPIVIAYTTYIYRAFAGKVVIAEESY
ncbi:MAG: cytochrome d ubiquinol oxidase subunit II [Planctomycetes bacterium]|nr:cytochrome d ubiquinol oxidase subunit II [Planctomycetota bacterium]